VRSAHSLPNITTARKYSPLLLLLLLFGRKIAIRVGNALEVYPGAVIEGVLDVLLLIGTALRALYSTRKGCKNFAEVFVSHSYLCTVLRPWEMRSDRNI